MDTSDFHVLSNLFQKATSYRGLANSSPKPTPRSGAASRRRGVALALCLAAGARLLVAASGEPTAEPREVEQARALAQKAEALRGEQPEEALAAGEAALRLFARSPDPEAEVATRNAMAWAAMVLGDGARARELIESAVRQARENADRRGEARAVDVLGVIERRWGNPVRAIELYRTAEKAYRELGDDAQVAGALNNLGVVYANDFADYEQALACQLEALAIRRRLGNPADIAQSLNNIGVVYLQLGRLAEAKEHLEEALDLRRRLGLDDKIASTLGYLGDLHRSLGEPERSATLYSEALAIRRRIGEAATVPDSLLALARVDRDLERSAKAEEQTREALRLAESLGAPQRVAEAQLFLAELELQRGDVSSARERTSRALELAEKAAAKILLRDGLELRSRIEEAAGQYRAALAADRRYKVISDQILDGEKSRRFEALESLYQAERKERKIQELETERAAQELQLVLQRRQRDGVLVAAVAALLLALAIWRRHRTLSRLTRELASANEQLEELSLTDSLTGLGNRRCFHETIGPLVARSLRGHQASDGREEAAVNDLIFFFIDLDHFKQINDRYGHEAGDRMLVQLGTMLKAQRRATDILVRWGGEEFLLVTTGSSRRHGPVVAEQLRAAIASHVFDLGIVDGLHQSCSIGFAAYPFLPASPAAIGWERTLALADDALYLAKRAGRNRWCGLTVEGEPEAARLATGTTVEELLRQRVLESRIGPEHRDGG